MGKHLFIGGPLDGERVETREQSYWHVVINDVPGVPNPENDSATVFNKFTYRALRLRAVPPNEFVYVPHNPGDPDSKTFDLIGRLLEHYRPGVAIDMPHGVSSLGLSEEDYTKYLEHIDTTGRKSGTFVLKVPYKEAQP